MNTEFSLTVLRDTLAVCRFDPGEDLPPWIMRGNSFHSFTRTSNEVSVVLPQKNIIRENACCERDWRAFRIDGKLDFGLTGVLLSVLVMLKNLSVSVFVVSTYNTDYILVKEKELARSIQALRRKFVIHIEPVQDK